MNDSQGRTPGDPGLSRRAFLRGSGAAAAATAALARASLPVAEAAEADATGVAMGPGAVKLTLDINGHIDCGKEPAHHSVRKRWAWLFSRIPASDRFPGGD